MKKSSNPILYLAAFSAIIVFSYNAVLKQTVSKVNSIAAGEVNTADLSWMEPAVGTMDQKRHLEVNEYINKRVRLFYVVMYTQDWDRCL